MYFQEGACVVGVWDRDGGKGDSRINKAGDLCLVGEEFRLMIRRQYAGFANGPIGNEV